MSSLAADIAPSPTTPVEIGTARSVRQGLAIAGSQHVARSCSQRGTSMWSSRFLVILAIFELYRITAASSKFSRGLRGWSNARVPENP